MSLSVYTVVAGDTLAEIGQQYGVTVTSLLAANPQITDRSLIRPGDRITIPPRVIDLETPDGNGSVARDINNNGQIVGSVQSASRSTRASLWQDGAFVDLGTLGGAPNEAFDSNDAGHVVGSNHPANNASGGFLWQDGVMIDLGTLGGVIATVPTAINDRDQVVGAAFTVNGEQHAFLWQDGAMIDLGTLDGTRSFAHDINERSQVVGLGSMVGNNGQHAFLWQDGVMTDLGTLGGRYSVANAINDRGQIVGWSQAASGERHAFLWQDGEMTDLGFLWGGASYATDINECGQVVGRVETPLGTYPFLWQDGLMISLGMPIGHGSYANAINDQGQIVGGWGDAASGDQHALLWQITLAGWPTVSRAGITLTGAVANSAGEMEGRLRLSITMTGLAPGEAVSLRSAAEYSIEWACGVWPEPCGELGCPPTSYRDMEGTAQAATEAVARSDGTATAQIEIVAAPPAESCPTDSAAQWGTMDERWQSVSVADPAHGLLLTPDTIEWGVTF